MTQSVAEKVLLEVKSQKQRPLEDAECSHEALNCCICIPHLSADVQVETWGNQWEEFAAAIQEIYADKLFSWSFYCFFPSYTYV